MILNSPIPDVRPDKIKDRRYIIVKFEKKISVVYNVGKVSSHYSDTDFEVSYFRIYQDCHGYWPS